MLGAEIWSLVYNTRRYEVVIQSEHCNPARSINSLSRRKQALSIFLHSIFAIYALSVKLNRFLVSFYCLVKNNNHLHPLSNIRARFYSSFVDVGPYNISSMLLVHYRTIISYMWTILRLSTIQCTPPCIVVHYSIIVVICTICFSHPARFFNVS